MDELLKRIAYCAEGMFSAEAERNFGEAEDYKRQLKLATDAYYDALFSHTGEQH